MARVGTLYSLPPDVQAEVLRRASEASLGGYQALEAWLRAEGYEISKSSLHRTLSPYEPTLALVRRARFLQAATGSQVTLKEALQVSALVDIAKALTAFAPHPGAGE